LIYANRIRLRTTGVVLKKKWGTPETRLRQRFLNNLGLHTCCAEIILHCVSVSNQLQQWTNFCTNFSPKMGQWGTRTPCRKKWGRTPYPRVPAPTPLLRTASDCGMGHTASASRFTDHRFFCPSFSLVRDNAAGAPVAFRTNTSPAFCHSLGVGVQAVVEAISRSRLVADWP